ncbi:MAG: CPBP family intramembrane metalloprotease [Rhodothermaceae bacterium]|nr:CPBP family intramembrane metalloprotease [Rhodothermaceae bacterium]
MNSIWVSGFTFLALLYIVSQIAITAGLCEEVIFRGYMNSGLKKAKQKMPIAILLSTLSFVFMHGLLPFPSTLSFYHCLLHPRPPLCDYLPP